MGQSDVPVVMKTWWKDMQKIHSWQNLILPTSMRIYVLKPLQAAQVSQAGRYKDEKILWLLTWEHARASHPHIPGLALDPIMI